MSDEAWAKYHLSKKADIFEKYKNARPQEVIDKLVGLNSELETIAKELSEGMEAVKPQGWYKTLAFLIKSYEMLMDRFSEHYAIDRTLTEKDGPALRLEATLNEILDRELKWYDKEQRASLKGEIFHSMLLGKEPPFEVRNHKFHNLFPQVKRIQDLENESNATQKKYSVVLGRILNGLEFYSKNLLDEKLPDDPAKIDEVVTKLKGFSEGKVT